MRRGVRRTPALLGTLAAGLLAVVGVAITGLVLAGAPASAAACSASTGVTVVVDPNDLGGGVSSVCVVGGGGKHAADLFTAAGFPLTYAQRQPGFVCRVSGAPTSDPCVNAAPADRYWGLWWSDGDPGSGWTYASQGVGSLTVPDGGIVAFDFDDVSGDDQPSAPSQRPAAAPASPTRTAAPTRTPTHGPTAAPTRSGTTSAPSVPVSTATGAPSGPAVTGPADQPTSAVTPGATPDATPDATTGSTPGASVSAPAGTTTSAAPAQPSGTTTFGSTPPSTTPVTPVTPTAGSQATGGHGLPVWLTPVVVLLLFGLAGGLVLLRGRRSGT